MDIPYLILMLVSCSFMLLHAVRSDKQTKHYLFVVFCGSMTLMCLQQLSAPSIGPYHYLIGLGACATCNVVWLISRALFRDESNQPAIQVQHIVVAGMISLLVMLNQTNAFFVGVESPIAFLQTIREGTNEILNLLSSTVLALSLVEAIRGFKIQNKQSQQQRLIFAGAFITALFNCMILPTFIVDAEMAQSAKPWLVCLSAIQIILAIHWVLYSQRCQSEKTYTSLPVENAPDIDTQKAEQMSLRVKGECKIENELLSELNKLMRDEQIYLQSNIKLKDLALRLNQSEYLVSRCIRQHADAKNVNAFLNRYRVEHAKKLMQSSDWSMLVISLESGFSSIATFNRVFKAMTGQQPSEFRLSLTKESSSGVFGFDKHREPL